MSESLTVRMPATSPPDPVFVRDILVRLGDHVEPDQVLVELEMEKATFAIPSPAAGTVEKLFVSVGDNLIYGSPIIRLRLPEDG